MCIKFIIKSGKVVQQIKEHKAVYKQQDCVKSFVFRRLGGEAWVAEMLGSLVVLVEEGHHVEVGPYHDGQKEQVTCYENTQK